MKRKNVFSVLTLISFGIIAGSTVIGAMPEKHANPLKATALNNGKFYSDYASMDDCVAAGNDVNINIAEEGFVLMKNDGTLPFDGVKNISVFGHNSVNPAYSGGGSGSAKGNLTPTSILDSLQAAGYKTNSVLSTFYQSARSGDTRSIGGMGGGGSAKIGETPVSAYDDALKASFKAYSDAALIVITRSGSEGADTPRTNVIDQSTDTPVVDQHYLELSKNEKDLISMVETSGAFSKIVIVLNSPSVMELKTIQDDTKINGMIWTGIPGYTGFIALGEILNGTVNPSGKTVDTYPVDLTKDPTFYNFGDGSQGMADGKTANYAFLDKDGNATTFSNNKFLRYEEGPYVGYRYYETRGVDDGPAWYAANVVYPFGFGLSYTNFSVTFDSASLPAASKLDSHKDDKITIKAKVKNTGSVAGKEVVEAYAHAPYIDGKIEKPSEQLVAFAKTKELQPNEEQDVDLEFYVQDMASYDYSDANGDGHKGYELDAGAYQITINTNAHAIAGTVDYSIDANIDYAKDSRTGKDVANRFDSGADDLFNSMPKADSGIGMTMMTRASANHFVQPDALKADESKISDAYLARLTHEFVLSDLTSTTDPRYKAAADMPSGATQVSEDVADADRTITNKLQALMGVAKDDAKWETLLNEMKWSEMVKLITDDGWKTSPLAIIGKLQGYDHDGPSGINLVNYCTEVVIASTWNVELAGKMGYMIGDEALWCGVNGWYGPAMDCHRSPFGGRNFEYFSEDGLLGGKMAAAQIKNAQEHGGVYAYAKHMAMNDQETTRGGIATFATEQAVREIYLRPFQLAVEEGHTLGIMTGMNKIGDVANYANYAELTQILRGEWDFNGVVDTDAGGAKATFVATTQRPVTTNYCNTVQDVLAGNDITLGSLSDTGRKFFGTWNATDKVPEWTDAAGTVTKSYSIWYAVREAAKNLLYVTAQSNLMHNGLVTDGFINASVDVGQNVNVSKSIAADTTALGTKNVLYYAVDSTALPTGMTLSIDGVLSGTPTVAGTYTVQVKMVAEGWVNKTATFTISVLPTLKYAGDDLAKAQVGTAFTGAVSSDYITTAAGYSSVKYSLPTGSALPDGMAIDETGAITGTPTAAGTYTFTVRCAASTITYWGTRQFTRTVNFDQEFTIVVAEKPAVVVNHTVTFAGNYTGAAASTAATVQDGSLVACPANLVRTGYIFTGWYTDAACTKAVDFSAPVTADATYYAGWAQVYVQTTVDDQIKAVTDAVATTNASVAATNAAVTETNANVTATNEAVSKTNANVAANTTAIQSANKVAVAGLIVACVGVLAGGAAIVLGFLGKKKGI